MMIVRAPRVNASAVAVLLLIPAWAFSVVAGPTADSPVNAARPTANGRWPGVISTGMRSSNLDRSIRFYTEGLGMVVLGKIVSGPVKEVIFGFQGKPEQAGLMVFQTQGADESSPVEHGNSDTKVVLGVADVTAVAARLAAAGYPAGDIQQHGSYRIVIAHDPDGYKYEIVEMPVAAKAH